MAVRLVYQLALILLAAKLGGELCVRFLKIPPVLGELGAGIIIGPFALGGVTVADFGPIFPMPDGGAAGSTSIPVSPELYSFSQAAAIVLLFTAGLDTNLKQFLKYAGPAFLVATGGIMLPFFLGAWVTVLFGFAQGFG
ncbi:MAG: cation:proton antiporter, partial [Chloroflexota bacterium]